MFLLIELFVFLLTHTNNSGYIALQLLIFLIYLSTPTVKYKNHTRELCFLKAYLYPPLQN